MKENHGGTGFHCSSRAFPICRADVIQAERDSALKSSAYYRLDATIESEGDEQTAAQLSGRL